MIRTKSVHSPIDRKRDGLRVLAARFRGRGIPTTRYDVWMPNLAPSERTLRSFLAGDLSWAAFRAAYRKELRNSDSLDRDNRSIKNHGQKFTLRLLQRLGHSGTVTMMCQCAEDEPHCHRHELKRILDRPIP